MRVDLRDWDRVDPDITFAIETKGVHCKCQLSLRLIGPVIEMKDLNGQLGVISMQLIRILDYILDMHITCASSGDVVLHPTGCSACVSPRRNAPLIALDDPGRTAVLKCANPLFILPRLYGCLSLRLRHAEVLREYGSEAVDHSKRKSVDLFSTRQRPARKQEVASRDRDDYNNLQACNLTERMWIPASINCAADKRCTGVSGVLEHISLSQFIL